MNRCDGGPAISVPPRHGPKLDFRLNASGRRRCRLKFKNRKLIRTLTTRLFVRVYNRSFRRGKRTRTFVRISKRIVLGVFFSTSTAMTVS